MQFRKTEPAPTIHAMLPTFLKGLSRCDDVLYRPTRAPSTNALCMHAGEGWILPPTHIRDQVFETLADVRLLASLVLNDNKLPFPMEQL
jgi:hypothetical protein